MIKRRSLLSVVGIGLLGLALSACDKSTPPAEQAAATGEGAAPAKAAAPQQTYNWRLVTSWPKNFPGLGEGPERFAEQVKRMTNGRIDIKVYGAGELVPALEVFDAVSQGTVEMGHGAAYYWKGKVPAAQFFTAVPFGLTAQEINSWVHYGGGLELWRELYAPFDLVPFAGGNTGVQMGGWFNKEINSLEDLKTLKMRIPGLAGDILQRAGGSTLNIAGGDIFTAMQTGTIDATEWVGPYNDLAFGLHKAAKIYYYPGWHEPGSMMELLINKKVWDGLPEDLKAIVENAARAMNADMLDQYTARNNAALSELVNKHHVDLRAFPPEVLAELRKLSDQVVQENAGKDPLTQKIYDSYKTFRDSVVQYHKISEQAYINARGD